MNRNRRDFLMSAGGGLILSKILKGSDISSSATGKGNLVKNPGFEIGSAGIADNWQINPALPGGYQRVGMVEPGMKWVLNPSFPRNSLSPSAIQRMLSLFFWGLEVQERTGLWVLKLENKSPQTIGNIPMQPVPRGAWQEIVINPPRKGPFLITAKVKGDAIWQDKGMANLYTEISVEGENEPFWGPPWEMANNYGSFQWRIIGFNTGTLPAPYNDKAITKIVIAPVLTTGGTFWVDDVSVEEYSPTGVPQAAATIVLDDADASQYRYRSLFPFPVSLAVITNEIEKRNPYYMSLAQLKDLQSMGWETLSHGASHTDLTQINGNEALGEFRTSKSWLERNGFPAEHFVLPYGGYDANVLDLARQAGYKSVRKAYPAGLNPPGAFPWDVRAVLIGGTTTFSEIQRLVNEAVKKNWWLVFYLHEINDSCADEYCTNPALIRQIVSFLQTQPLKIVTYGEGFRMFAGLQ